LNKKGNLIVSYFISVIIFLLFNSCTYKKGQLNSKDSIVTHLIQQGDDSIYLDTKYTKTKYRQALFVTNDSLKYYEILSKLNKCFFIFNQFDSVYSLSNQILFYCNRRKQTPAIHSLIAETCFTTGNCYAFMSKLDSAFKYYNIAIEQVKESESSDLLPDLYINYADAYIHKSDFVNAAYYYRKAMFISDSLHVIFRTGFPIYFGLGQTYMELRDFELSDTYYKLAWKYFKQSNNRKQFIYCNNRGNYYYYKEEYANALPWFQKARELAKNSSNDFYLNLCEGNMGEIYLYLNKLDSSGYYLDKSFHFFSGIKQQTLCYYIATVKAGLALKLNNILLAHRLLEKYNDSVHTELFVVVNRNRYLQQYYEKTGNYKQAYNYQYRNIHLNDSIRAERQRKRVADLDMRYQQDTTLLNHRNLIHNMGVQMKNLRLISYIWILIAVVILASTIILYFFQKKQHDIQWLKHVGQLTRLRMENLRNRMSPHFIFNILKGIKLNAGNPDYVTEQMDAISLMLLRSIENIEKPAIVLSDEIELVHAYVLLQKRSIPNPFEFEINVSGADLCQLIPAMMIQIPVENAIKHGLKPLGEKMKKLAVTVKHEEEGQSFIVEDNGIGFTAADKQTTGTGTGLKVLLQTIHLLNSKNRNNIRFSIYERNPGANENAGTIVEIFIPFVYSYTF